MNIEEKAEEADNVLDIGAGDRPVHEEAYTVDRSEEYDPDMVHDMKNPEIPLNELYHGHFDLVVLRDVVEHLPLEPGYLDALMQELERLTPAYGKVYIRVPHFSGAEAAGDWQHSRNGFSASEFHLNYIDSRFSVEERKIRFAKRKLLPWNYVLEPIANKFPWFYEHTPLKVFPAKNVEFLLKKRIEVQK